MKLNSNMHLQGDVNLVIRAMNGGDYLTIRDSVENLRFGVFTKT